MPRLKYHNPAISMTVNRSNNQEGPATLTVYFAPPPRITSTTASPAPSPSSTTPFGHTPADRMATIDMKHKNESEILSRLLELTRGVPYKATPEELDELMEVDVEKRRSERDRDAQAKLNEVRRQEQALLDKARGRIQAT